MLSLYETRNRNTLQSLDVSVSLSRFILSLAQDITVIVLHKSRRLANSPAAGYFFI